MDHRPKVKDKTRKQAEDNKNTVMILGKAKTSWTAQKGTNDERKQIYKLYFTKI